MAKRRNVQSSAFGEIFTRHREGRGDTKPAGAPSGKAVGKSADPDFVKLTCYIRKETHLNAKRKLLYRGGGQLSDLVEELITAWLKT